RWILGMAFCVMASGACERPGNFEHVTPVSWLLPERLHAPLAYPADPVQSQPKNPIPVDVGKGIEAKLDQLLDAIKGLTLDALKAAYMQGVLHGALVTALVFTLIIAFSRRGAS